MIRRVFAIVAPGLLVLSARSAAQAVPFAVADSAWDSEALGNHRAVVTVTTGARAVRVTLPWRRPDSNPAAKGVIVIDGHTGLPIPNVRRGSVTQAAGTFEFEPTSGAGHYYVYYLPYQSGGRSNYPNVTYLPVTITADPAWLADLTGSVPEATVDRFEAVDSLNSFEPMEVVATEGEVAQMLAPYRSAPYLVFPEDRSRSIRMRTALPFRWAATGPSSAFAGQARRGEFYAFQLGIYAQQPLTNVRVALSALLGPGGASIAASRTVSFNDRGINWDGRPFSKVVTVEPNTTQSMWCGIEVPAGATPGIYRGQAVISSTGTTPKTIALTLEVGPTAVTAGGANEPEKLTRLAWLNSTRGQRNDVIAPYVPLRVTGSTIALLGRRVILDRSGLPARIETFFTPEMTSLTTTPNPVLARPMQFEVAGPSGPAPAATGVRFTRREPGTVAWTSTVASAAWTAAIRGTLEFDGYLNYQITLKALKHLDLLDVRLAIPYAPGAATYAMGLGLKGQRRPDRYAWQWDVAKKNQDGAWLGGINAGLFFSLRSDNYSRPLNTNFYLQKPLALPPSWGNQGRGAIEWTEQDNAVVVKATSGPRTMQPGDSLRFDVTFLITPFHPIDPDYQWGHRFYHRFAPLDTVAATGANVINVHHATPINPYINYPFIAHREMKGYVDAAHQRGLSVKIYNTVRELSNRSFETFALRSLGHEVYSTGKGGGYSWLQEHLRDDYIAAWFVPELKDAAVINAGMSRWHNYYVEGINWLTQNVGIDGLYLDDVAFDRTTMKRVKRMLLQNSRPGIVDLHSANQYNERDGFINSAMLYLEHFPYLNRLWFGEYFDYEKNSADFFLTEVSGIPFGLMGEMLEGGGNPWRGMIYGMTNRMPWSEAADPRPLWKLWDDFGIKGSRMLGYWAPTVPVRPDLESVKATVYQRNDRTLVALASWATEPVAVKLTIDWKALGLDPRTATITAPAIAGLQDARGLRPGDSFEIAPGKGMLLIVR